MYLIMFAISYIKKISNKYLKIRIFNIIETTARISTVLLTIGVTLSFVDFATRAGLGVSSSASLTATEQAFHVLAFALAAFLGYVLGRTMIKNRLERACNQRTSDMDSPEAVLSALDRI